ncbi:MAG: hypothetical protein LBU89_04755, partial [Fibromonadaceae bacterium]|nr:hypothetical protein [Fibromonadaceae bacterium]
PGYPEKLTRTTWVITGILSDLDNMVSTVELLEAWGIEAKIPEKYLLLEDERNILTETEQKIKLEDSDG